MSFQELVKEHNRLEERKNNVKSFGRKAHYIKLQMKVEIEMIKAKNNENV